MGRKDREESVRSAHTEIVESNQEITECNSAEVYYGICKINK